MDKLAAMRLFSRVVETGGIARAATGLGMPKATATTLLQKLEASLGVTLLSRTTRRVNPTADGLTYYERCVEILATVREAEESLLMSGAKPRGRIRVDAPTLLARSVIVPALPTFFASYPEMELELGCTERRADLVEEGIDCAVWSGELQDSDLIARDVGLLYLATCAAPSYLQQHGQPEHPRDLDRHQCINHFSRRTARLFDWVFEKDGVRTQTSLRGSIAVDDENSYVAAAEAGLGIAQIPAFVVKEAMERRTLELVLGDWLPEPASLNVVYPQHLRLSSRVRVFVQWITDLFREHDGIQLRSRLRTVQTGR
jgi:LysR family transcriptional regulator, regulator for bpeEF and oprC